MTLATVLNDGNKLKVMLRRIRQGWEIVRCSCTCGGSYAWMKPRRSGAHETAGCVCHNTP